MAAVRGFQFIGGTDQDLITLYLSLTNAAKAIGLAVLSTCSTAYCPLTRQRRSGVQLDSIADVVTLVLRRRF